MTAATSTSTDADRGQAVFAHLVALLLVLSPITLHVPEQIAHRTKQWKPRHGHQ